MKSCELKDIDSEDIEDIISELERSFDVKFSEHAFEHVTTFGGFVTVIESSLSTEHINNCSTQQAFYKIRRALGKMNLEQEVEPSLELHVIFPRNKRRILVESFTKHLGMNVRLLEPHIIPLASNTLLFFTGIILLFFNALIGVGMIAGALLAYFLLFKFGKELRVKNIRELSAQLVNENYASSRSDDTINRNEIWNVVESYFTNYGLTEKLVSDSKFGWA